MNHTMPRERYRYLPWIICGFAGLFYLYQYLLRIMPSVMTSQLMDAFHLTPISFANLVGVYYYVYIPMQLLVGISLDRFGPKRLLTVALLTCALGTYLFADSSVFWQSLIGRLLVGLGSAFAFVGVLKIASMWLPKNRFSLITGATVSLGMLGGLIGDVLLTNIVSHQGWRLTNNWVAILGIILALLIFLFSNRCRQLNLQHHYQSLPDIRSGCRGLLQLIKNRQIWINSIIGCLLFIPVSGFAETWGISYLMAVDHLPKAIAADAISMIFLGWVCGAPLLGWISDTIRSRRLPLTVAATGATILLSIILYVPDLNVHTVFLLLFIFGLFSSAQVIVFSVSHDLSPQSLTATAAALTNMIVMFSGASISVIGFLLNISWQDYATNHMSIYSWDFQLALSILPLSLTAAVFLTFYLQETYAKSLVEKDAQFVRQHYCSGQ